MSEGVGLRPRRTQAERTATAHRRMIRAAIRLIARQGYTKTTLAEVGREAGYTAPCAMICAAPCRLSDSDGTVPEVNEVFAELNRGFRETARGLIQDGMDRGEIRSDLDPEAEAGLFVGMLRGASLQWMADPGCFDLDALAASLKDALRRHLAA